MRRIFQLYCIAYIVIILSSCSKPNTSTLLIDDIQVIAAGPLFEGSNTAQGEVANRLNAYAKEKGIEIDKIVSASIKKLSLSVADSINFDLFSSINVQFASDKTNMIDAASINKIDKGSKLLELAVSGEQKDLIEVLKQEQFTLVADAIITKDSSISIPMKAKIEIELHY